MFEVYRNGISTHCLFLSEDNAKSWISRQADGATYTVETYGE